MKITLLVLCIIVLVGVILPYLCLLYTRNKIDWIIIFKRPARPAQMNRYIRVLELSSNLLFGLQQELDIYRIDKLRDMLKEMQQPHG